MRLEKESADTRTSLISIHAPLTGCDVINPTIYNRYTKISIHAPLTGCDHFNSACVFVIIYFNPRTPYGMRPFSSYSLWLCTKFQSTHPLRDATITSSIYANNQQNFNPRTPYGMRRYAGNLFWRWWCNFNPRTPYGMRQLEKNIMKCWWRFQSTHPLRDATVNPVQNKVIKAISIHAPLTGCDLLVINSDVKGSWISIHAPLTGCDYLSCYSWLRHLNFNPRTPYGMRHRSRVGRKSG